MALEVAVAVLVFVAVTGVLIAAMGGRPVAHAVEQRLGGLNRPAEVESQLRGGGLLKRGSSRLPLLRMFLANGEWSDRAQRDLQQAGSRLRVGEYFLLRLLAGVLAALALIILTGGSGTGLIFAIVGAAAGYMVPGLYMQVRKGRRQAAISSQLVEAVGLIANALRSGFAFTQAVELAAKQLTPPIRDEFDSYLRDNALGARAEDSLRAMVDRSGSVDMEMMVTTIMVQRTTGGNLSEILDNVAETIRERERLQGEIRALTAQQRLTGLILSIYPLILGALFFLISPSLMKVLWEEDLGRVLLLIAGTLQVIGALTIRQVLRLDV